MYPVCFDHLPEHPHYTESTYCPQDAHGGVAGLVRGTSMRTDFAYPAVTRRWALGSPSTPAGMLTGLILYCSHSGEFMSTRALCQGNTFYQ